MAEEATPVVEPELAFDHMPLIEHTPTPKEEPEAKVETPSEPKAEVKPEPIVETPKASFSAEELARIVSETVQAALASHAPRKEEPKPEVDPLDDVLKQLEDETIFDPKHAAVLKAIAADSRGAKAENKKLAAEVAQLRQSQTNVEGNEIRRRLEPMIADVDASLVGEFKKPEAWNELMGAMSAVAQFEQRTGKHLQEPERLHRAVAMLGRTVKPKADPAEAEKKAAFDKHKEEYDKAALSTPQNRQKPAKFVEQLNEKIYRNAAAKTTQDIPELINEEFVPFDG